VEGYESRDEEAEEEATHPLHHVNAAAGGESKARHVQQGEKRPWRVGGMILSAVTGESLIWHVKGGGGCDATHVVLDNCATGLGFRVWVGCVVHAADHYATDMCARAHKTMVLQDTMSTAQTLYEGGYITYMRTDNPVLSTSAVSLARVCAAEQVRFDGEMCRFWILRRAWMTAWPGSCVACEWY
jgi:hypothetical protein